MLTKMVIETLKIRKEGEDLESATTAAALLKLWSVKIQVRGEYLSHCNGEGMELGR